MTVKKVTFVELPVFSAGRVGPAVAARRPARRGGVVRRRSQRRLTWSRFRQLLERFPDALFNLRRSRVRESRTLGSVGAKAEWLSYPNHPGVTVDRVRGAVGYVIHLVNRPYE